MAECFVLLREEIKYNLGLGAATPVCPSRARGVYSLAYMLQGR